MMLRILLEKRVEGGYIPDSSKRVEFKLGELLKL